MTDTPSSPRGLGAHQLTSFQRAGVMLSCWIPLFHVVAVIATLLLPWGPVAVRVGAALAMLYLAPPLAARILLALAPIRGARHPVGSPAWATWWVLLMLQTLFCRFPALEEALRLVPTLYSLWLRLWGSRVGRLVYWSPGTEVFDRSFLEVGDDVVFGGCVRLTAHLVVRHADGSMELLLAPIRIGPRVLLGACAGLSSGAEVAADEAPKAFTLFPPFAAWRNATMERRPWPDQDPR